MNLIEYPDRDTLMRKTAQAIVDDLAIALQQRDQVLLAVPGGTTPGPVFDILSATALDWARVHVILTDERWVPESDAESNAALLRKRLLVGQAATAEFTTYFTEGTDIATAAQNLSAQLQPRLPVDVLLLGMGADMHTASLFPRADGLQAALAQAAPMLLPVTAEGQKSLRFSLTAPVLRNAAKTHLLITGSDKRTALTRAASLPPEQAPVQIVLSNANVHWSAS